MDRPFVLLGFVSKVRKPRYGNKWEDRVEHEVSDLTESQPPDVTIVIPAAPADLGTRLEITSRLMKEKGYRLRQVVPMAGTTWAASFMRLDD